MLCVSSHNFTEAEGVQRSLRSRYRMYENTQNTDKKAVVKESDRPVLDVLSNFNDSVSDPIMCTRIRISYAIPPVALMEWRNAPL